MAPARGAHFRALLRKVRLPFETSANLQPARKRAKRPEFERGIPPPADCPRFARGPLADRPRIDWTARGPPADRPRTALRHGPFSAHTHARVLFLGLDFMHFPCSLCAQTCADRRGSLRIALRHGLFLRMHMRARLFLGLISCILRVLCARRHAHELVFMPIAMVLGGRGDTDSRALTCAQTVFCVFEFMDSLCLSRRCCMLSQLSPY